MARIGYARVSSIDQDLDIQVTKLKSEGCEIVRSEKISGGSREGRVELETVIQFLRPGDELVVARLDRFPPGRTEVACLDGNWRDARTVHLSEHYGEAVTVLDLNGSTRGEMGNAVLTVLGMAAQWRGNRPAH